MQQDGRGSVTSRFRRPPTDQLTSAEGRNSKIQEVSQHSESRTPNVRGVHRRRRRSGRSRSMSISPKRTSVFSRIRHDRSESPRHRPVGKGRRDGGVFNRLGAKKIVRPHTRKAATRVPAQEERNSSSENVTMKERVHEGQKCSPKVKIVGGTLEVKIEKAKVKH
ncbi:hypothetical protein Tco_1203354 [Tanacetum coccineum]